MVEFDLGYGRAGSPHITGWRVHQEVLPRTIQPIFPGDVRGLQKNVPGELVDLVVTFAMGMAHENRYVVASVGHETVNKEPRLDSVRHFFPYGIQHRGRRLGMPSDGAYVCFDDR